jgi:hypothetical protein
LLKTGNAGLNWDVQSHGSAFQVRTLLDHYFG